MSNKHTIEYIRKYFEDNGCKLLSNKYENNRTKLKYICMCGNIAEIMFNSFQYGSKCKKCAIKYIADKKRHSFIYIKKYFNDNGCVLLDTEYKNTHTPLTYICKCSNMSKITFANFQNGKRCMRCAVISRSGENNGNYNQNLTDIERLTTRSYPEYIEWRKAIYERDNYTCQKCGDNCSGNLNAHHIEAYATNKNLRTHLNNGITFCKVCHSNFHHQYGYNNCTVTQLKEFLNYIKG